MADRKRSTSSGVEQAPKDRREEAWMPKCLWIGWAQW